MRLWSKRARRDFVAEAADATRQASFAHRANRPPTAKTAQQSFDELFDLLDLADAFGRPKPDRRIIVGEFLL